jgi:capsular exopolysaccharide synthesis family protein
MKDENKIQTILIDNQEDSNDEINLREFLEKYSYHWKWFLLSFVLALSLAFFYLKITQNQYRVTSTIFIDDKDSGGLSTELSAFEDLGVMTGGAKKSVINETGVLKSRTLMENVIKDLKLNITYYKPKSFINFELYNGDIPFYVDFLKKDSAYYKIDTSFIIQTKSVTHFLLKDPKDNIIEEVAFGDTIKTSFGELSVIKNLRKKTLVGQEIIVKIDPLKRISQRYRMKMNIEEETKKSSLLILSLTDKVKRKGQDILDNLVYQYNKDAIEYKTMIAENTDKFINDRISDISADLTNVDRGVEEFKTKNKLTDIGFEASLNLQSNSAIETRIVELSSQIKLVDYIQNHMSSNKNDLIPANLGLKDAATSENTVVYNQLLLERNRIIKGSRKLNPAVINLDAQIATLRQSIEQSLTNLKSSLQFSLNEARNQEYKLDTKRQNAPKQEREFQDIKRKQQIVETLYLYLLEKREENAISLGIPVPNAKIVDKADGSDNPVSPKGMLTYLIAAILGLSFPAVFIFIQSLLDNKIHTREDVEAVVKAPILGDIPCANSKNKIIINDQNNSNIAESFRLLRTNISFMLSGVHEGAKSIFITSTVGAEGKTFVSINLAASLALLNKKVLLIGADIRKPKINEYLKTSSQIGLTHFLMDFNLKVSDVISHNKENKFDVLESGAIPPNPSELLLNGRIDEILAYGKKHYDYIIIDTAPVNLVTDTLLLSHYADLFIYVVRANYLDKRLLKIPKLMYQEKRLPNMAILINDLNYERNTYGYGYGYGYGKENKKPWYKKWLS